MSELSVGWSADPALLSDAAVAAGLVARRHEALGEAYSRHHGPVCAMARRLCGPDQADDVVQDVFLRLWRAPEAFDPARGSLRSYLLMMTHGRSVDLLRSHTSRRRRERATHEEVIRHDGLEPHRPGDLSSTTVGEMLGQLSPAQREAIELAYRSGYTYRQVGLVLGVAEGTVKGRIRAGLVRLRTLMIEDALRSSG